MTRTVDDLLGVTFAGVVVGLQSRDLAPQQFINESFAQWTFPASPERHSVSHDPCISKRKLHRQGLDCLARSLADGNQIRSNERATIGPQAMSYFK